MKTLQQLREKYWSNATSLYPPANSPLKLQVRFDFSQFGVDKAELLVSQKWFKTSMMISKKYKSDFARHEANFRANHHLAGAYQIEGKNVDFWNQFL